MDITTIAGFIIALGAIAVGYLLEGGSFTALIAISPILIIFGGTIGVVTITQPLESVKQVPKVFAIAFKQKKFDYTELIENLTTWSKTARTQGVIALEAITSEIQDPYIRRGLSYVIDSIEPEQVKTFLENEIDSMQSRHSKNAAVFGSAGGFAPTMGVVGTVLGLVVVLSGLGSSSVAELGHGIAVAFLATFMGVGAGNLLFLPLQDKLKNKSKQEVLYREIAMQGIIAIQSQESPLVLKKRLESMLPEYMKKKKEA